jgi:hypothetical protein
VENARLAADRTSITASMRMVNLFIIFVVSFFLLVYPAENNMTATGLWENFSFSANFAIS